MFRLIEDTSAQVGLYVNAKKTQFMTANIPVPKSIKAKDGTLLIVQRIIVLTSNSLGTM